MTGRIIEAFERLIVVTQVEKWFQLNPDAKSFRYLRYFSLYIAGLVIGLLLS